MHNDSFLSICWIERVCVCVCVEGALAGAHTQSPIKHHFFFFFFFLNNGQQLKDSQTGNIQVDVVTLVFFGCTVTLLRDLRLTPADLSCIAMYITTALPFWERRVHHLNSEESEM